MKQEAENIWSEDSLDLISAGREESPSPRSREQLFASLGLAPAPTGPGGPAVAAPAPPPRSGVFARPLPWVLGGLAALAIPVALLGSSALDSQAAQPETPKEPKPSLVVQDETASSAQNSAPAPRHFVEEEVNEAPVTRKTVPAPVQTREVKAKAAPTAAEAPPPSLAEEIALIKQARAALSAGDSAGSKALLREHAQKFSSPQLGAEAQMIRIELLVREGQLDQAKTLAQPLRTPGSPYRARLDALLSK